MTATVDNYRGAMVGLAFGDALGAPYEFKVPPFEVKLEFLRGHFRTEPGYPTDDTFLAASLAEALLEGGDDWPDVFIARLVGWARSDPPDIGLQTEKAAVCWATGERPPPDENAQGNGSLMAVTPLVLRYATDHDFACASARAFAHLTHPSTGAAETNARFAAALVDVLDGGNPPRIDELPVEPHGDHMGWCRLTCEAAFMAYWRAEEVGPVETLLELIRLGGDTDTNAAVAGALLGAKYGAGAWPPEMIEKLYFAPVMTELADKLWAARND